LSVTSLKQLQDILAAPRPELTADDIAALDKVGA
jgi:hypothetical protein